MKKNITFFVIVFLFQYGILLSDDEHGHEDHHFHTGLLLGYSANLNGGHNAFTLGLEQEFVLSEEFPGFGVGLHSEIVFADNKEYVLAAVLLMNPMDRLHLAIGPGVIFHTHEEDGHVELIDKTGKKELLLSVDEQSDSETNFLITTGLHYDFHLDMFTLSPAIEFHFFEGKTDMTIGIVFGIVY